METAPFDYFQMSFFLGNIIFLIEWTLLNILVPMKNCPGGVHGRPTQLPGYIGNYVNICEEIIIILAYAEHIVLHVENEVLNNN